MLLFPHRVELFENRSVTSVRRPAWGATAHKWNVRRRLLTRMRPFSSCQAQNGAQFSHCTVLLSFVTMRVSLQFELVVVVALLSSRVTGFSAVTFRRSKRASSLKNQQLSLSSSSWQSAFEEEGPDRNAVNNSVGSDTQPINNQWLALTQAKLQISTNLVPLHWLGQASLPTTSQQQQQTCLVLASTDNNKTNNPISALLVPIDSSVRPLEAAQASETLSAPTLLRLNLQLVNRDGCLFDNVPWSTWTTNMDGSNNDAAGNVLPARFHLGKRAAYNVLMGQDWSVPKKDNTENQSSKEDEEDDQLVLARRLLQLQKRETQMDLAECDYQIAVADTMDRAWALEDERQVLVDRLAVLDAQWQELIESQQSSGNQASPPNWMQQILSQWRANSGRFAAPYRGAIGYAPQPSNNRDRNIDEYTSPYAMFKTILKDQCKAQVIGAVLENTSLLEGTTVLGGVLVLQRMTAQKSTTLAGETVTVLDETEDYGNKGIAGGEMVLVECDADEALGMSLACEVPLHVPQDIWERCSVMVQPTSRQPAKNTKKVDANWETVDPELSVLMEGQAGNQSATERVAPLRSPRGISLFDTFLQPSTATSKELFPTDNPIQSLEELDQLSNEAKARTLLSLSNFEGRLPRPRAVVESEQEGGNMNALDQLLLPLIDESVRREYYIRQAVQNGDLELAQELESSKSMRQIAKEKAAQAKEEGELKVAAYWEKEANLYSSLRADVTQDEGAYSRFLDRDEWYERDRRKTAARVDRKKFGNLLDGIE